MRLARLAVPLALTFLGVLAIAYAVHVPAVVPATARATDFSAERAMVHVRQLSRVPRPTGSVSQARALEYIMARLAALGLEPHIQQTTGIGTRYAVAGRVRNILARVPGTWPSRQAVLLMAHYDGVPAAPAAGDDAAGTAVLLEALRALRAGPPLRHDVIVLFTDAEEAGLLGAAAFAREHDWAKDVGVVLNFEARGTSGPSLMFETGAGNLDVARVLRRAPGARATSLSTAVYRQLPNDTDLSEIAVLDRPALNFAFIGGVERYHTSEDDVAHLSQGSVQHHGNQALALARAFAAGPLPRPRTGDAVFFNLPLVGLIVYPVGFALPIALLGLALAAGAVVLAQRRGERVVRDATLGAVALIVSLLVTGAIAAGVAVLLQQLHAALPRGGAPQWRGVYGAAIAFLSIAVVASLFTLARRVATTRGLALGPVIVVTLVGVYLSAAIPGVSFLFAWPALAATIALVFDLRIGAGLAARAVSWLAAALVVFLMVPTIHLMVVVALGLDPFGAALLGVLTAIATWLVAPMTGAFPAVRSWRPTLVTAIAAGVLLAGGAATVRTDAETPAAATFVYGVDSMSGVAWLTGNVSTPAIRPWMESALRSRDRGGPGVPLPPWVPRSTVALGYASAPVASIASPSATVLSDSATAAGRRVTFLVRAGQGARSVVVAVDSAVVQGVEVDGRPVDRSRYRGRPRRWSLEYVTPPDTGFALALTVSTDSGAVLVLMSRHMGIPGLPRFTVPVRPEGVVPIQMGDATHVYRVVRF